MSPVIEIRHYLTRSGRDVFDEWLTELADAVPRQRLPFASTG